MLLVRQTHHILDENYGASFSHGTKGQMSRAISVLQRMSMMAMGFHRGNIERRIPEFRYQISQLLSLVGTQPHDLRKRQVIEYADNVSCGRDRLGRVNASAIMAQLVASQNRLRSVIKHILNIEPWIIARQQALISIVNYAEVLITGLRQFLDSLLEYRNFYNKFAEEPECQQRVAATLLFYEQELRRIDVAPYWRCFFMIREEFRRTRQAIEVGDTNTVNRLLTRTRESLKLRAIRIDLERVLLKMLLNRANPRAHRLSVRWVQTKVNRQITNLHQVDESGFSMPVINSFVMPCICSADQQLRSTRNLQQLHTNLEIYRLICTAVEML